MVVTGEGRGGARGRPGSRILTDMVAVLTVTLIVSSFLVVLFVLLHRGKGGGLSSMFGGGMGSNLTGSSIAEKNLDRFTVAIALIWTASVIGLGLLMKTA